MGFLILPHGFESFFPIQRSLEVQAKSTFNFRTHLFVKLPPCFVRRLGPNLPAEAAHFSPLSGADGARAEGQPLGGVALRPVRLFFRASIMSITGAFPLRFASISSFRRSWNSSLYASGLKGAERFSTSWSASFTSSGFSFTSGVWPYPSTLAI